jgi:hypothetical protein
MRFLSPWIQKMCWRGLLTPWNIASSNSPKSFLRRSDTRLWVARTIHLLQISLKRIRLIRCFQCPRCRKRIPMVFRRLVTSQRQLEKSRFCDVQKADYELWGPFAYIKLQLSNFVKVVLFDDRKCRIWVRKDFRRLETFLHPNKTNSFFKTFRGKLWGLWAIRLAKTSLPRLPIIRKMRSNVFPTSRNIASSNSAKLIFNAFRRQIIGCQGHCTT